METLAPTSPPAAVLPVPDVKTHDAPKKEGNNRNPNRRLAMRVLGTLAVILPIIAWLAHFAHHSYFYEETDDAYVVGHLHQISPQIAGQVKTVLVEDNQVVKAGDPLVDIDPFELEIAVQKLQASVAQSKAKKDQVLASAVQAKAQLNQANAVRRQAGFQIQKAQSKFDLTKTNKDRLQKVFENGGLSQAQIDAVRTFFQFAQADLAAAQSNQTAVEARVASARAGKAAAQAELGIIEANIATVEAALKDAQRQLTYTTIKAPVDGRIGNCSVEIGNRVVPGQSLLALAEPNPWIVANFKETQLIHMQVGQNAKLSVDAIPGANLHGRIDSFSPASSAQFALLPADNATGNFNKVVQRIPVKIIIDTDSQKIVGDCLRLGYSVIVDVCIR